VSRRELLARGAALGGTALIAGPLAACGSGSSTPAGPRVVVVGAGLAGLTAAYLLHRRGTDVSLYEAHSSRVGGRCWSSRDYFADGQVAEHGGEFIDTDHTWMRALVRRLGLRLEDRNTYHRRRAGRYSRLYLDGSLRDEDDVYRDYAALRKRLRAEADRIGYLGGDYRYGRALAFDRQTAARWLDRNVPGGGGSLLGQVARGYLASEFGADAERLGATNLLYILEGDSSTEGPAETDGSDERFHVHGGNDRVPRGLAERLPDGALHLDAPLEAVWRRGGSYGLRFRGVRGDVAADHVVLAIPFTTLRDVDLGRAGLSRMKRQAIDELGMGTNAKLLMQFRHRPGHYRRWDGYLATDEPGLETWDTSLTQSGADGLLTVYSGGAVGAGYRASRSHGPAPEPVVRDTLAALDRVVPGLSRDFNGRAWLDDWVADPWVRGSYAAFLPGQSARYMGVIKRQEGRIHFAGEHTSVEYQGFLEGAVRSGERCASEILNA
jgi:monoamine oxidase